MPILVLIIVPPLNLHVATSRFSSGRFSNGFRSVNHSPNSNAKEEDKCSKEFPIEDEVCCRAELSLVYKPILKWFP